MSSTSSISPSLSSRSDPGLHSVNHLGQITDGEIDLPLNSAAVILVEGVTLPMQPGPRGHREVLICLVTSSGRLKFFGSKSESAAGIGLIGDALGMELLGTPLDATLPGDCILPQPAPSTQRQEQTRDQAQC